MLSKFLIILITVSSLIIRRSVVAQDGLKSPEDIETLYLARSAEIRKYMNESIHPCENFYQFACGNWPTHHPANKSTLQTIGFYLADSEFNEKLTKLLTATSENDTSSEGQAKNFYESCMSFSSLKLAEYRIKLRQLVQEFGEMPALNNSKRLQGDFDWLKTVAEIAHKYGIHIVVGYSIECFRKDINSNALHVRNQEFALTDTSRRGVNAYKLTIEKMLINVMGIKKAIAKRVALSVAKLEAALVRTVNEDNTLFIFDNIEDIATRYKQSFDVMKLMNISYGLIPYGSVFVKNFNYFEQVNKIMDKAGKVTQANYIFYHLIRKFHEDLKQGLMQRYDECVEQTRSQFSDVVSKMCHRSFNLKNAESQYYHMWQNISTTLQNGLESNKLSWFDDESREYALEKLHLMKLHINTFEGLNLDDRYQDLIVNNNDYIENLKSLGKFNARKMRESLNQAPDFISRKFNFYSPVYVLPTNAISLSVAPLLTDFYLLPSSPNALKFSRLGFLMGHEVMHGFSAEGRDFNRLGSYTKDVRNSEVEAAYEERRQCYYKQYRKFYFSGEPLPQDYGQGENAADNIGLLLAYETYLRWLNDEARTKQELAMEKLPHLDYTHKQLFFIGYTQTWCADMHADYNLAYAKNDDHSMPKYRGFVPLLNFDEFSKEFNCPLGSPMNPYKKCTVY